ncbi:MAG: 5-formyltetrahydrofolate cyclo-ligase [Pseudomonadales bacterium]
MTPESKRSLRSQFRNRRHALSPGEQQYAAAALKRNLVCTPEILCAARIAFYVAQDGEIDPADLMTWCLKANKRCYLPVLAPGHHEGFLWFGRARLGDALKPNRFGIPEPVRSIERRLNPWTLDVVLVPLVAFDERGHRLGMGGGFYDRSLEFAQAFRRPWLVGLAHGCQRTRSLPADAWDIPLDAIATDTEILRMAGRERSDA